MWRENHVKATDGSLRGLCKEGKKQMTEHTEHALFQGFRGNMCRFLSAIDSFTAFKVLCGFQDQRMN